MSSTLLAVWGRGVVPGSRCERFSALRTRSRTGSGGVLARVGPVGSGVVRGERRSCPRAAEVFWGCSRGLDRGSSRWVVRGVVPGFSAGVVPGLSRRCRGVVGRGGLGWTGVDRGRGPPGSGAGVGAHRPRPGPERGRSSTPLGRAGPGRAGARRGPGRGVEARGAAVPAGVTPPGDRRGAPGRGAGPGVRGTPRDARGRRARGSRPRAGTREAPGGAGGLSSCRCAPEGIRTPNLLIRSQMLYPLSYGRVQRAVTR